MKAITDIHVTTAYQVMDDSHTTAKKAIAGYTSILKAYAEMLDDFAHYMEEHDLELSDELEKVKQSIFPPKVRS